MAYRRHKKNINAFIGGDEGLKALYQVAFDNPVLDREAEEELARKAKNGDVAARDRLIVSHMKLAFHMAASWGGYPVPRDELVSSAMIGLSKAVEGYDVEQGNRFSTYAAWWIRAELVGFILQNFTLAKHLGTPAQRKLFFNLKKTKRLLNIDTSLERGISDVDAQRVADHLGVAAADVILLDPILTQIGDVSLNAPAANDSGEAGMELMDLLPSSSPSPFEEIAEMDMDAMRRNIMNEALQTLDERSRDIVQRRRLVDKGETLDEVSVTYGVSRERIRQIEEKALKKIQRFIMRRINPSQLMA